MHLTNDELFEVPQHKKNHIVSCTECTKRIKDVARLNKGLNEMEQLELPRELKSRVIDNIVRKKATKSNIKRLFNTFSMAATIAIVILAVFVKSNSHISTEELIVTSQKLELRYNYVKRNSRYVFLNTDLYDELARLDSRLQNAYLEHDTDEVIKKLWQERIRLLNKLIDNAKSKKRVIKI